MMANSLEIEQWRADTPGCQHRIHLNNAGASLMPQPVVEAITQHLLLEAREGGYEARQLAAKEIEEFYEVIARLLNTEPRNIAYAENGTVAYNRALTAIPFQDGDVIVTTAHDYVSNQLAFISLAKRFGVKVIRAQNRDGVVDLNHLEELIRKHQPKLVSVTHIPTSSGVIQPVEAIGEICEGSEAFYMVDAVQSVGQMPVDVTRIKCDFLSVTARKFLRGPRGAGFLYVSDRVLHEELEPLFVDLRGSEWVAPDEYQLLDGARRFEMWELPYMLLLGVKAAANYAMSIGLDKIRDRSFQLAANLRHGVAAIAGVEALDRGSDQSAIVSIKVGGVTQEKLSQALKQHNLNFSITSADNALLDFREKHVKWALRMSPHYYNTDNEIDVALEAIGSLVEMP